MDYLKLAQELQNQMSALIKKSDEEKKALTEEDMINITGWQKDIDNYVAMAEALKKSAANEKLLSQPAEEIEKPDLAEDPAKSKFSSFGEQLQAIRSAANPNGSIDPRLVSNTSGNAQANNPHEGGFAIDIEFAGRLMQETFALASIASSVDRKEIGEGFSGAKWWSPKETSRVTGSRNGGIQGFWGDEAQSITLSKANFEKLELTLEKKLMGLSLPTFEMIQDATFFGAFLADAFKDEFSFLLDEAIYSGVGAGRPLGILNSNALVSVAKEAGQGAKTIVFENVTKMLSRIDIRSAKNATWYINQDALPQLQTMALVVGTGGVPVYMPAGGASETPFGTLFSRPVMPIEQAKTVGTLGDLTFADFSQYMMIEKKGMQMDSSIHAFFQTAEEAFRFILRVDGRPKKNNALTPANGTNTVSPFVALAARA